MKRLKWGIVGLGRIARQFTEDLQFVQNSQLVAVGSRNIEKATSFAREFGVPRYYSSYREVFEDTRVDIVYIATPHYNHAELSIEAMNKGKHVLCEKPVAVNAIELKGMIVAARANEVFFMEALWSRFNPGIKEALRLSNTGALGQVNYVNADFTFNVNKSPKDRMLSLKTAGGSLLEMGIYPVFLAYSVFGMPDEVLATGRLHPRGGDIQTGILLKFSEGIAVLLSGYVSQSDMVAKIYGSDGQIFIKPNWHETQGLTLIQGDNTLHKDFPTKGKGFTYEIEECFTCIRKGELESRQWSHQDSLSVIQILDEVRRQIGLFYENDNV